MAKYVDGFVFSVPKKNLAEYKKMAQAAGKEWMKHGALDYKECMADDVTPDKVKFTFPKMAKTKDDEVVFFSFITFKSKGDRNKINKKVMAEFDTAKKYEKYRNQPMPFDMKRFAYGGFTTVVDAK